MTPEQTNAANLIFMALAVWREARGESADAQLAVAYVIRTRANQGGWWGNDISSVVGKQYQFSSMTVAGDPNLVQWPRSDDPSWDACVQAAQKAITVAAQNPALGATSYYDISIPSPSWAKADEFIVQIGRLRFYRIA